MGLKIDSHTTMNYYVARSCGSLSSLNKFAKTNGKLSTDRSSGGNLFSSGVFLRQIPDTTTSTNLFTTRQANMIIITISLLPRHPFPLSSNLFYPSNVWRDRGMSAEMSHTIFPFFSYGRGATPLVSKFIYLE